MDKRKEIKRLQEILAWMKEPGMFSHRIYKDHWWRTYGNKYKELIKQYKKETNCKSGPALRRYARLLY